MPIDKLHRHLCDPLHILVSPIVDLCTHKLHLALYSKIDILPIFLYKMLILLHRLGQRHSIVNQNITGD